MNQWKYVSTKSNPVYDASRGLNATNINKIARWFSCPEFLWEPEAEWDTDTDFEAHDSGNSEICHHLEVNVIIIQENDLLGNLEKRIFVGTNEFTCICEEICFYIEASSQDQRAHKEYQQTEFTFAKSKKY